MTAKISITKLTDLAPIIRGLMAEPSGDEDMPFHHVILNQTDDPNALEIALADSYESPETLHDDLAKQLTDQPGAVSIDDLGSLAKVKTNKPELPLHNKVAVVTGAAGAIGHGICRGLLEQGAYLAATDLPGDNLDNLVTDFNGEFPARVIGIPMDVTDKDSVVKGYEAIIEAWGGVDIIVVNAGIALVSKLVDMDLAAFQKVEKVNVDGTLLTIAEGSKILIKQNTGGDIVLVSTKNVFMPGAGFGAYSATKAASHQLARIASQELAPYDIRVNMVAPDAIFSDGQIKSGLWAEVGPDRMKARGLDEKGLENYYHSRNLLKKKVTARHVANGILFFVTHQTPTTGATIPIDGGLPDSTPR